jgi:hypothetical protein
MIFATVKVGKLTPFFVFVVHVVAELHVLSCSSDSVRRELDILPLSTSLRGASPCSAVGYLRNHSSYFRTTWM